MSENIKNLKIVSLIVPLIYLAIVWAFVRKTYYNFQSGIDKLMIAMLSVIVGLAMLNIVFMLFHRYYCQKIVPENPSLVTQITFSIITIAMTLFFIHSVVSKVYSPQMKRLLNLILPIIYVVILVMISATSLKGLNKIYKINGHWVAFDKIGMYATSFNRALNPVDNAINIYSLMKDCFKKTF